MIFKSKVEKAIMARMKQKIKSAQEIHDQKVADIENNKKAQIIEIKDQAEEAKLTVLDDLVDSILK